ncbi:MAG: pyridoxamine 5'-phosphate oxidase [Candidatus Kapaibacteriales bacterium]
MSNEPKSVKLDGIADMRQDYTAGELGEGDVKDNPFIQFAEWFEDAKQEGFKDPNAMSISTVGKNGRPSSRMVLLKGFDESGFVFYTNYESRKANQIDENSFASLLFYWDKLERQVRIEGKLKKTTLEESEKYFKSRPLDSRIGARVSKQSRPLSSRGKLAAEVAKELAKHPINPPLPEYWGGYRLIPEYFEFWQGRRSRLHDRIVFELVGEEWNKSRLYP